MASPEVEKAELGTASAGSRVDPEVENNSVYQPIDRSQNYQREELQVLGTVQILTGAIILALGVFLGSLQNAAHLFRHFFFFTFYTGYPLWGAVFFISSGSISVAAGRNPTRMLMQNSFGMNISSATIALLGLIFLSINLAVNSLSFKGCQSSPSPDLCIYTGVSSNGLVSLMLILTLLELCVTISVSALWCRANCSSSREVGSVFTSRFCGIKSASSLK
ncbi:membrane-spanning 4-domains subfamily A member 3 isoform X1 [Saccopteryx leptura]|uniref:membrane-spanning 4-domains subfamily A member 3 isoform X1 n=1 Tax=Saccopteryx leptura TaxID=249018 RepID=UPI00339C9E1F